MQQAFTAVSKKMDPMNRGNSFEIFGFDFILDSEGRVYLIECNSNPAIATKPGDFIMSWLVPHMLESAFKIALDPIVTPNFSLGNQRHKAPMWNNLFRLCFDEKKPS